ncbi:LysM peptidoglycan-binding domain-containing protein [Thalassovita sp.]|uniref:LysM peptidoglycan-binding domain-containing protein n=1 Tax=Thalassovita sp. TaxID=1979401 RepID=UPI0029DE51AF|nr:LysM peptidoglycan-binding domain-containing protein [Thalassovita sp.]
MNEKTDAKGGQTLTIAGAAVVAIGVAVAYLTGLFDKDAPAPVSAPVTVAQPVAPAPETAQPEAKAEPAAEPEKTPEPAEKAVYAAPAFDVVRVEADGTTLVAGTAVAGAELDILLDGAALARAMPSADGKFAEFLNIDPSDQPRVLSLMMYLDGQQIASDQTVIIAPVVQVAEAEPASSPETEAVQQPRPDTQPDPAQVAEAAPAQDQPAQPAETTPGQPAQVAMEATAESKAEDTPKTPTVILADKDGVKVIQPAASDDPAPQTNVSIDAVSYTEAGDVTVAGRGKPGLSILLYLNNVAVGGGGIGSEGRWESVLTGIEPGLYTLRADEVEASGKVLSRVETPFLREAPEKVAAVATPPAAKAETATPETENETPAKAVVSKPETMPAAQQDQEQSPVQTAEQPAEAPVTTADTQPAPTPPVASAQPAVRVVTVQPGSTLWAIAREKYGEGVLYVRVYEANKTRIRNPDLIYPGQVFVVPE